MLNRRELLLSAVGSPLLSLFLKRESEFSEDYLTIHPKYYLQERYNIIERFYDYKVKLLFPKTHLGLLHRQITSWFPWFKQNIDISSEQMQLDKIKIYNNNRVIFTFYNSKVICLSTLDSENKIKRSWFSEESELKC